MTASHGTTARRAARTASHSWPERLVRAGLAARGVLYLIIGILALQVAFGDSGEQANQNGALQEIAGKPFGGTLTWIVGVALVGYALWRLAAAVFSTRADPTANDGKGRVKAGIEAALYGGVAITALKIASGSGNTNSGPGTDAGAKGWTAKVLEWPAGPFLVGLVGVLIAAGGLYLVYEGWKAKFTDELQLGRLSPGTRKGVIALGRFGRVARGSAFTLIGALVLAAAVTFDADKARSLDGALKTLVAEPYGPWLLGVIAVGLIGYGIYCFVESRYRRVRTDW
jgi:hypothetical protein